jgi:hypothetical protein
MIGCPHARTGPYRTGPYRTGPYRTGKDRTGKHWRVQGMVGRGAGEGDRARLCAPGVSGCVSLLATMLDGGDDAGSGMMRDRA